ncbi:hypothetical protein GLX_15710 [Komagataeibacter medellinensis NBRC 3288]|uniref:Uncharacterized protein n=1 Tax=Komagataeibacter medellinensis (strain NBRC 3288 / BCRC 11682 / LMG 1693 / Kondo 51) TaxID=634177 RepID=G2I786_KOMMN|nr:hypothetical protein GLX_15710 [Komagataeibacter medellinensis NBRC 3288]
MHDLLVFSGGAIIGQILAITAGLYRKARRARVIDDRLGPPAP